MRPGVHSPDSPSQKLRGSVPFPFATTPSSFVSEDLADDERSSSEYSYVTMVSDNEELDSEVRYPGEDTRPTSQKELLGFYLYSFAAEVFIVCGIGMETLMMRHTKV